MHNDGEWFKQRAFREAYVIRELVTPFRRMAFVPLNCAVVRVHTGKLYVFTEVVAAVAAEETLATGNTRFDGYAIACYTQLFDVP